MRALIAYADLFVACVWLYILSDPDHYELPKRYRAGIAVVIFGLISQVAIYHGIIDRVTVPLWAGKDFGIWWITAAFIIAHYWPSRR